MRKLVTIESPYSGDVTRNLAYLTRCMHDSLARGEAPFAMHGFYTHYLNDDIPEQRQLGIDCGLAWTSACHTQIYYTDLGWSPGMLYAFHEFTLRYNHNFRLRSLDGPVIYPACLDEAVEALLIKYTDPAP